MSEGENNSVMQIDAEQFISQQEYAAELQAADQLLSKEGNARIRGIVNRILDSPEQKAEIERAAVLNAKSLLEQQKQARINQLIHEAELRRLDEARSVDPDAVWPSTGAYAPLGKLPLINLESGNAEYAEPVQVQRQVQYVKEPNALGKVAFKVYQSPVWVSQKIGDVYLAGKKISPGVIIGAVIGGAALGGIAKVFIH